MSCHISSARAEFVFWSIFTPLVSLVTHLRRHSSFIPMAQSSIYLPPSVTQRLHQPLQPIAQLPHSNVLLGYLQPGRRCVVKSFRLRVNSESDHINIRRQLENAALQWKRANHPNVNKFIGLSGETPIPSVVTAYVERDIMGYLASSPTNNVSKFAMLYQVADALAYMHSQTPPILHTNITGSNVLVDSTGRALLTDIGIHDVLFPPGVRIPVSAGGLERRFVGPRLSPRTIGLPEFTPFVQVMTQRVPYAEIQTDTQVIVLMQTTLPMLPQGLNGHLRNLLLSCWAEPRERMPMHIIAASLRNLSEQARS
ncbi:hypothetical protein D9756_010430 [Leucocoprinus leucothites]|uniref:Protein kinase domain-containing protein n=1 Tax=Leucocoprinus leucothites TaxID=201217 RepID=A0A8H5CRY8_9AGAR|nr:hypothetical protein D9756_010430 [Leucoagaricus leucothites]